MIKTVRSKALRYFLEKGNASMLPAQHMLKIHIMLDAITRLAIVPDDLLEYPHWRPHQLKGSLAGYWSLTVTANFRIIFRFSDGHAYDVDYVDYH